MAETHAQIKIYVNKDVDNIIRAKQFDAASRFLDITLLNDDGAPLDLEGHKVRFNAKKRDLTYIFNDCKVVDPKLGLITVELTDQTLAIGDSVVKADISIHTEDERCILTTRCFEISVQVMMRNDAAIESSNEFGSVIILFQDVWDMRVLIRAMHDRLGQNTDELTPGQAVVSMTVFGLLNKIYHYLIAQSTAAIADIVTRILNLMGVANPTTSGTDTVMNYLKRLDEKNTWSLFPQQMTHLLPIGTTETDVYYNILTVTGRGRLNSIDSSGYNYGSYATVHHLCYRITMDGKVIELPAWKDSTNQDINYIIRGYASGGSYAMIPIPFNIGFNSSLVIEVMRKKEGNSSPDPFYPVCVVNYSVGV